MALNYILNLFTLINYYQSARNDLEVLFYRYRRAVLHGEHMKHPFCVCWHIDGICFRFCELSFQPDQVVTLELQCSWIPREKCANLCLTFLGNSHGFCWCVDKLPIRSSENRDHTMESSSTYSSEYFNSMQFSKAHFTQIGQRQILLDSANFIFERYVY